MGRCCCVVRVVVLWVMHAAAGDVQGYLGVDCFERVVGSGDGRVVARGCWSNTSKGRLSGLSNVFSQSRLKSDQRRVVWRATLLVGPQP